MPLLCDPDADDESRIEAVLAHYQGERRLSEPARGWLAGLGIDDERADELRIGVSNRTLGYRLPEGNRKDGARLRERLISLGLYFVGAYWDRGGRREGSVTLLRHAMGPTAMSSKHGPVDTADPAFWSDGMKAVAKARSDGLPEAL